MHKTMKEMPDRDRPYEKCVQFGPEFLTDAELLAAIIRTGSQGEKSVELAQKILELSNTNQGILGIVHLTVAELMQLKGIGKVKAIQIKCIAELSKRIAKTSIQSSQYFSKPSVIAAYYMEELRHLEQEEMRIMFLNSKNRLLKEKILTKGTVNSSLVSPREIFIEALRYQAVCIAMVHNHPSGDPSPSREDILATKRVQEVGNLIGISLIDHIIIGDNRYVSLKERGIV